MTVMTPSDKAVIAMQLPRELITWIEETAQRRLSSRTQVVRELILDKMRSEEATKNNGK